MGDRGAQVVHHQRVGRRHHARGRGDQPRGPPAQARVDPRSCRRARRAWRSCATSGRWRIPMSSTGRPGNHAELRLPQLPGAGRPHDRRSPATGSCSRSSASAAVASTTRCAGWARRSGRSTSCASARCRARSHGKLLAQHQMVQDYVALSHTEIQAARLLTFQTAWKMDKYGASRGARRARHDQGPRVEGRARGARPHDPGVRRARLLERPPGGGVVPVDPVRARSATVPTSSTSRCSPAPSSRATRRSRAGRPSTSRAGAPRRRRSGRRSAPRPAAPMNPPRAVFFDFAGTLFSARSLRDVHLEQLRLVGDAVGVTASDDELRAAYRRGLSDAYREVATRPYYLHRELFGRAFVAMARTLGGALDTGIDRRSGRPPVPGHARHRDAAGRLRRDAAEPPGEGRARPDRLEHRRRPDGRAGGTARAGARGRRVDQLRGRRARASPTPASTRSRWRSPGVAPPTCCSWATAPPTTSSGRGRRAWRPRCSSPTRDRARRTVRRTSSSSGSGRSSRSWSGRRSDE